MVKKLTKLEWLQAGFRALSTSGLMALKVEPLAKTLSVSKGSFYWHFKDLSDFKSAMIVHWQQAATADVITQVNGGTANPVEKLFDLANRSTELSETKYGGTMVETAIREWSRYEPEIAKIVTDIDAQRLAFTESLFLEAGHKKEQARQSAHLLYSALIGLNILSTAGLSSPRKDLTGLLEHLLKQSAAR